METNYQKAIRWILQGVIDDDAAWMIVKINHERQLFLGHGHFAFNTTTELNHLIHLASVGHDANGVDLIRIDGFDQLVGQTRSFKRPDHMSSSQLVENHD